MLFMLAMDGVCVTGTLEGELVDTSVLLKRTVICSTHIACSELLSSGTVASPGRRSTPWVRWGVTKMLPSTEGEVGESGRVVSVGCLMRRLCVLPSD